MYEILGDVASDAAHRHLDPARIRVPGDQLVARQADDIDVRAAKHQRVFFLLQNVAFAENVALLRKVRDVNRYGGTGDSQKVRELVLRDGGILTQDLQEFLFPVCHSLPPKLVFI